MRYTITALTPNAATIEVMRHNLMAVGAKRGEITVDPATGTTSQHHISVKTDNLEASEAYREVLELAGGVAVASNEESSVFNAVKVPGRDTLTKGIPCP